MSYQCTKEGCENEAIFDTNVCEGCLNGSNPATPYDWFISRTLEYNFNDIHLSEKDAEYMASMIENPPEPNDALKDLFKKNK
jgi:hypothetical protein